MSKEAKARIKINKLLEEAGWRFLDNKDGNANVVLENKTKLTQKDFDNFGDDFEKTKNGFIDYLLLDDKGFPLIVLEAKKEEINPLFAKEQARKYAISVNCRFIILSNGNIHYFWDLERGNPSIITKFPRLGELEGYKEFKPNKNSLINETVEDDYVVKTQKHDYENDPRYQDEKQRHSYIEENKLRFLRKYQVRAVERIQEEVKEGKDRFLLEMATGTGKTLTSAAIIKLFLRTGNARRVLFLVDRLELEDQAHKAFTDYLKTDYKSCIYKENKDDWRQAEIVVSTIQSFTHNNKYKRIFHPDDFDLIISDEAHRSIGGNGRAVFEYFIGYKLGLTATPKDYLKKIDFNDLNLKDPRQLERRMLLDTYTTFDCVDSKPTYQYSLLDGVKDGYLVNPIIIDARTQITTQLLSDEGYIIEVTDENNEELETSFTQKDFEKKFYSDNTNQIFCKTFLENALIDPISGEIGKSIVFCVSQNHAAKITQILNQFASKLYPNKYQSDFALQVTSLIQDAQQSTINFTNNRLSGKGNFLDLYQTSKTRVCVTVGMMTTGYDCPDLLNVCLMRPIFSPTDFIQIKGRGTRKYNFSNKEVLKDNSLIENLNEELLQKKNFKLFDFFANCEYFEEKFNYDEVIKLPAKPSSNNGLGEGGTVDSFEYESLIVDPILTLKVNEIGLEGMKIDRMYFDRFEDKIKQDTQIINLLSKEDFDSIEKYIYDYIFEKPEDYFNITKLRSSIKMDRRISLREMIEKIFGRIPYFKSKDELLDEEFDKFDSRYLPSDEYFNPAKNYFKSYLIDAEFRDIIEKKNYALLNTNPNGNVFRLLPTELRQTIDNYIKDYVPLNKFIA